MISGLVCIKVGMKVVVVMNMDGLLLGCNEYSYPDMFKRFIVDAFLFDHACAKVVVLLGVVIVCGSSRQH